MKSIEARQLIRQIFLAVVVMVSPQPDRLLPQCNFLPYSHYGAVVHLAIGCGMRYFAHVVDGEQPHN